MSIFNYRIPPPPPFGYFQLQKLEFRQILGLWVFSITEYPPPWKLEFRQILGLWVFSITEYPPSPKIGIEADLGTLGIFNYRIPPPPPPRKLEFRQILGLWVFSITEYPPSPPSPPPLPDLPNGKLCSKLPHVETLSNPDNYSFLLPATKLGQVNIFTGVCDSVNRGGCLLGGRVTTPGGVYSGGSAPRGVSAPPGTATAAGGTHPTGMHSCCDCFLLAKALIFLTLQDPLILNSSSFSPPPNLSPPPPPPFVMQEFICLTSVTRAKLNDKMAFPA